MSYFSEAIEAYMVETESTNMEMAGKTDLNHTDFSRWRRGVDQPTEKAIRKLLPALPSQVALKLLVCWLLDETPEDYRHRIMIRAVPSEAVASLTNDEWTAAKAFFEAEGEHNPLMRQTLVGLHRLMRGKPTASPARDTLAAATAMSLIGEDEKPPAAPEQIPGKYPKGKGGKRS